MNRDELVTSVVYPTLEAAGLPRPARVVRVAEGVGNHVYFAGAELVVRVGTGTDGAKFPAALAVLRAAAGRVRVPAVLYEDVTQTLVAYPVMVLERLAGAPLSHAWPELEPQERMAVLEGVTAELDRLHAIPAQAAPGAGFPEPWWQGRVAYIERELRRHREADTFPAAWLGRMERYVDDHRDALASATRVGLLHGDVGWGNVVVDQARCGLIDFDETRTGPAEEDSWQVLFETGLETTLWMPLARLRALPGFDLSSPGVLERFLLREIEDIFLLLSGTLSWKTAEVAREDAMQTYHDAFETDRFARLLERFA
jgi:aminoglycoside phosphotransferase (APT) family kinase protein